MEPQGSRERPEDQLQGSAVQDQAIPSEPERLPAQLTPAPSKEPARGNGAGSFDRVVIQFGGRVLKGYTDRTQWPAEEDLATIAVTPPIRLLDSPRSEQIPLDGVKAVFFVKSFEGKSHDDLRFHDHLAPQDCLWVRATFLDGEVIEGLIGNTSDHVLHNGFYMFPVDPEGNNLRIYVLKNKLKEFQVLGLRPAPRTMRPPGVEKAAS